MLCSIWSNLYYLIDHPASQPGPSCSPSCGAPSRQPPWVRGWSRLSPLETSTRGCPPSWEDVMDRDGDGGRPYGGWTIFVDDDNYHIIMTSAPSCRISFSPSTLVHTALCNILTTPLHQGQLRYMVGNSPTMGGFPTTIWKTNH